MQKLEKSVKNYQIGARQQSFVATAEIPARSTVKILHRRLAKALVSRHKRWHNKRYRLLAANRKEAGNMMNGIYIQTEDRGKLIRKIVCNGEERWFIGSDCAVTFLTLQACKAAIDALTA